MLHVGDCLEILPSITGGSVPLVFADPPFNIGYAYDVYDDNRSRADYLAWADRWLAEVVRVLAPAGTLWIAIGDEYAAEYKLRLDALGLTMRNWVVWHYAFGTYCTKKFGRNHTHLFYYTKHRGRFTFNADAIRVPSDRQAKYGDKRAVAEGRVPGDVWEFPRVCGTFRERNKAGHACQMPESVLERIILACSNPGDTVLDPFAGTGTTLAVAQRLGREWIGVELSHKYANGIRSRLRLTPEPSRVHSEQP